MNNTSYQSYNCSTTAEAMATFVDANCSNVTEDGDFVPASVRTIQATVYIIELILGVSLNLFLVFLILFSKSLRQRGFAVAVQILLANVAFAVPVLSTSAHTALAGDWTLGDGACQFIAFCNQSLQPLRWLLTAVLVIDRALTVRHPFKYEVHGTKVVVALSVTAQLTALLMGIISPSLLSKCNGHIMGSNTCHGTHEHNEICPVFAFAYVGFLFLVGGVLPFCLYVWMLCRAKKANRQVVAAVVHVGTASKVSTVSQRITVSPKQVLTMFILFWTLMGCILPYYLAFLLTYLAILARLSFKIISVAAYLSLFTQPLYYALVIADPIALMWHKDVKNEIHKCKKYVQTMFSMYFMSGTALAGTP